MTTSCCKRCRANKSARLTVSVASRHSCAFCSRALSASADSAPAEELFPRTLFRAVESPPRGITFQDGNNRNIEMEAMELTKNSLLQNVAIELLNAQFTRLQAVISERP